MKLLGANPTVYEKNTFAFLDLNDLFSGLIKAAVFGLILTLTGCVRGYYTSGGAEGVGRANLPDRTETAESSRTVLQPCRLGPLLKSNQNAGE